MNTLVFFSVKYLKTVLANAFTSSYPPFPYKVVHAFNQHWEAGSYMWVWSHGQSENLLPKKHKNWNTKSENNHFLRGGGFDSFSWINIFEGTSNSWEVCFLHVL